MSENMDAKDGTRIQQTCPVAFVGAGPGDPELITVKGRRRIERADLVLYAGSLVPREVIACAKRQATVMDSSSMTLEETHKAMVDTVRSGGKVARVHTGDPSLYGAIREQMKLLEKEGIPYEVIPGVTAGLAAAAAARVSLTVPEATQSVIFTRVEGKTPVPKKERIQELASHGCSMVVYLSASRAHELSRSLLEGGYSAETCVVIGQRVGWKDEQIIFTSISELGKVVEARGIKRQAVFLILPGEEAESTSRLYDPKFSHTFRKASSNPMPEE